MRWEGIDPETQAQWNDTWEPRSNLAHAAKSDASLAARIATLISGLSK